jgi:hypothetical protein
VSFNNRRTLFKTAFRAEAFPEIPFFLLDPSLDSSGIEPEGNFLHKRSYENGYPDKSPVKLGVSWFDIDSCTTVLESSVLVSP